MKKFYMSVLKPIGYKNNMNFPGSAGFKEGGHTSFLILKKNKADPHHFAFLAKNKKAVRDFHAAALKAGGKDNGGPGLRKEYGRNYYAAFVYDPEGNNVESVCFN